MNIVLSEKLHDTRHWCHNIWLDSRQVSEVCLKTLKLFFDWSQFFSRTPKKKIQNAANFYCSSSSPSERRAGGKKESFQGMEGSVDFRDLASATCFEANANLSRFQGTCISVEERRRRLLCYAIETRKNVAQVHALGNWLTRQNGDAILAVRNKFLIRSSIFVT